MKQPRQMKQHKRTIHCDVHTLSFPKRPNHSIIVYPFENVEILGSKQLFFEIKHRTAGQAAVRPTCICLKSQGFHISISNISTYSCNRLKFQKHQILALVTD